MDGVSVADNKEHLGLIVSALNEEQKKIENNITPSFSYLVQHSHTSVSSRP